MDNDYTKPDSQDSELPKIKPSDLTPSDKKTANNLIRERGGDIPYPEVENDGTDSEVENILDLENDLGLAPEFLSYYSRKGQEQEIKKALKDIEASDKETLATLTKFYFDSDKAQSQSSDDPVDKETQDDRSTIRKDNQLRSLDDVDDSDAEFVIDRIIERGAFSVLFGKPGSGKSTLVAAEAVSIASGVDILGLDADLRQGKVAFFWADEGEKSLKRKVKALCQYYDLDLKHVFRNMRILGKSRQTLTTKNCEMVIPIWAEILQGYDCLFIDSLSTLSPELEIANDDATKICTSLEVLAKQLDIGIRIIHHSRKSAPGYKAPTGMEEMRGASAILGRSNINEQVLSEYKDGERTLSIPSDSGDLKYRNSPHPPPRFFRIQGQRIDDEKYPPPIVVKFDPKEHESKFKLADEHQYLEAVRNAFDERKNYMQNLLSPFWLGTKLAMSLTIDIGTDAKNNEQRTDGQKTNRKLMQSDIDLMVARSWIKPEKILVAQPNRTEEEKKGYVLGDGIQGN